MKLIHVVCLLWGMTSLCFGFQQSYVLTKSCRITRLSMAGWGNYKSDGKREGSILFALTLAIVLKANFSPADLKNMYICPSGPNAEVVKAKLTKLEPDYNCIEFNQYWTKLLTAPIILPGNAQYDPE